MTHPIISPRKLIEVALPLAAERERLFEPPRDCRRAV